MQLALGDHRFDTLDRPLVVGVASHPAASVASALTTARRFVAAGAGAIEVAIGAEASLVEAVAEVSSLIPVPVIATLGEDEVRGTAGATADLVAALAAAGAAALRWPCDLAADLAPDERRVVLGAVAAAGPSIILRPVRPGRAPAASSTDRLASLTEQARAATEAGIGRERIVLDVTGDLPSSQTCAGAWREVHAADKLGLHATDEVVALGYPVAVSVPGDERLPGAITVASALGASLVCTTDVAGARRAVDLLAVIRRARSTA